MPQNKTETIVNELTASIASGELGRSGDKFMTTRELCVLKGVSLKTAFHILGKLMDEGVIEKSGHGFRIAPLLPSSCEAKRPLLIGFLATCLESPYFAKLACHAEEFAYSVGASLIIASSNYDFATECERLKMFCRQGVAGILICPWASTAEQESFYSELPVPYVMLGRKLESVECDAVLVNNQKAAQHMARHLIEQGLSEFAYIGQSGKLHDQRMYGFQAELSAAGFALPEKNIVQVDGQNPRQCREAIQHLLKRARKGRLGLFCYHDLFAIRAINLCHQIGLRIPEDVAVAGFDDLPAAAETYPPLTSVSYPVKDMARLAFESLYARIKFKTIGGGISRYLDSKLIVRESTSG
ncbi:MAG: substrate-binding domain-containing protein [Victivallales bacterium]|nr:substrate-binding domain-containing protein [Victivallales bacterium]